MLLKKLYHAINNYSLLLILYFLISCQGKNVQTLFQKLSPSQTGLNFKNELIFEKNFDVFRYRNYYNGGGVGIADINNDGLPDVYLVSNMDQNKLFLNKGNFKFENITEKSQTGGNKKWSTGVSMADVNGDGWMDIYVCNSGDIEGRNRRNELFINNGDLTFTESARQYGLDDNGFSTHASFFDYDQDGDLDCYVLNNSFRPVSTMGIENIRHVRDSTGGDRLYRNDSSTLEGLFADVSEQAGIYGSLIGFGLGVTITDVNQDHWMDIYISNDFFERDYLYINNHDGTFKEDLPQHLDHLSQFSMGADAGDINNDGYPDLFVTDMLSDNDHRLKTMTNFENYHLYQAKLENGYYEQYMRNMLHVNRGDGTFYEIGQYAGVEATDWSWGALIVDLDNDNKKEIFVANGVYKDVTNQDFVDYLANTDNLLEAMRKEKVDFQQLVDRMPSNKLSNYVFKQTGQFKFDNFSHDWGLDEPSFSNGAAYGDLDNDGDLDLIVNNVNQDLFAFRNQTESLTRKNYLKVKLLGPEKNKNGIGAIVKAHINGQTIAVENNPNKGFQSSVDPILTIGLDSLHSVDSLVVYWGYHKKQMLKNVLANQQITFDIKDANDIGNESPKRAKTIFERKTGLLDPEYRHIEDPYVDFDREPFIYHMISREGPALAVTDINADDLDDFYVGAAIGEVGKIYLQNKKGTFRETPQTSFTNDRLSEDVDAVFFDADGDNDQDLYITSGGYAYSENSPRYQDRLYKLAIDRSGNPIYELDKNALPRMTDVGSCVRPNDYDDDGDIDLFVGSRAIPGKYGIYATSHLLENDGAGKFSDVTKKYASGFHNLGMVTDARWGDIDEDGDLDLVVVGEWMPIVLFKNNGTNLERLTNVPGLVKTEGWWTAIKLMDLNHDDHLDLIVGNWGTNARFRASREYPMSLYINDYDQNNRSDLIFTYFENDKQYPVALRHELIAQIPDLKKKFPYYEDYAGKTVEEIFTQEQISNSYLNNIYNQETSVVFNIGDGSYQVEPLSYKTQFSPVFSIVIDDFNSDSLEEIFMAGNFSGVKPEEGRYDANTGIIINADNPVEVLGLPKETGLNIRGDARKACIIRTVNGKKLLVIAKNNDELEFYEY